MNAGLARLLARPIAHRGLHDAARGVFENTFAAAERAVALGFGIECDVQVTADGEAVVFHDGTLDRLTDRTGRLDGHTAAALAAIPVRGGREGILTLPAFLRRIAGRVPVVVEIKNRGDGDLRLAAPVVAALAAASGVVALKSFDPAVMARCRQLGAACPLGLIGPSGSNGDGNGGIHPAFLLDFLSWRLDALPVLAAERTVMPLMSWTVRSRREQEDAARFGAQIVFEDYLPA